MKFEDYPIAGSIDSGDMLLGLVGGEVMQVPKSLLSGGGGGGSGGWTFIEDETAVNQASVEFEFPSGYSDFMVLIDNLKAATADASLCIRFSQDGGATWVTSASYFFSGVAFHPTSGTQVFRNTNTTASNQIFLHSTTAGWGISTTAPSDYKLFFSNPLASVNFKACSGDGLFRFTDDSSGNVRFNGQFVGNTNPVNAVQFLFDAGNVATGLFRVFGLPTP